MARNPGHTIRIDDELWDRFGRAVKATSPELTCSMVIRELMRYWTGLDDAPLHINVNDRRIPHVEA